MVALNLVNRSNKRRQTPDQVSELTTNRLSVYLRCLNELDAAGVQTISSQALAEQFHLNAAQIRKDLAYFGEFGVRGVGYYVKDLRRHLRQILGLDRQLRVAIMGAGNLGLALADYPGFRQEGFEIAALFDAANEKIGHESRSGVPIYDIKELQARGAPRAPRHRRHRRSGAARAAGRRQVDRGGDQGHPQLLAGRAEGAAGREAEERRSDRLAREPVVLSGAGRCTVAKVGAVPAGHRSCRISTRSGKARMVDVGDKPVTAREALAGGEITMSATALRLIRSGSGGEGRSAADCAAGRHHGGEADRGADPAVSSAAADSRAASS